MAVGEVSALASAAAPLVPALASASVRAREERPVCAFAEARDAVWVAGTVRQAAAAGEDEASDSVEARASCSARMVVT